MVNLSETGKRVVEDLARRFEVSEDAVGILINALAVGSGRMAQFSHPDLGGMGQWTQGGMIMIGDMFNNGLKHRVDMLCNELSMLMRQEQLISAQPHVSAQSQHQSNSCSSTSKPNSQSENYRQNQAQCQSHSQSSSHSSKDDGKETESNQSGSCFQGASLFVAGAAGGLAGQWWPAQLGAPSSTGSQNDLSYAYFPAKHLLAILVHGRVTVYDTGEHQFKGFSQQQGSDQSLTFTSQFGLVKIADLTNCTASFPDGI